MNLNGKNESADRDVASRHVNLNGKNESADRRVSSRGVNLNEIYEWLGAKAPSCLSRAVKTQGHGRP